MIFLSQEILFKLNPSVEYTINNLKNIIKLKNDRIMQQTLLINNLQKMLKKAEQKIKKYEIKIDRVDKKSSIGDYNVAATKTSEDKLDELSMASTLAFIEDGDRSFVGFIK